jgi:hypothetical protein
VADVTKRSVEAVVEALTSHRVRYLIAGGLAVVAHGYVRFTADVDIILDLQTGNIRRAIAALESLGYRPRAPVPFADFAEPEKRQSWMQEKGLTVFSLYSPDHLATEIDLFVEPPLDFDAAYRAAARFEVAPGVHGLFVAFDDLLRLKERAHRSQDLQDIERLKAIRANESNE